MNDLRVVPLPWWAKLLNRLAGRRSPGDLVETETIANGWTRKVYRRSLRHRVFAVRPWRPSDEYVVYDCYHVGDLKAGESVSIPLPDDLGIGE